MTKKTTLKHMQENGTMATRQTARAYTHVLLCKVNNALNIAAIEASRETRIAHAVKRAKEEFKDNTDDIAAGAGGMIRYKRGQGGYQRFADGSFATYTQEQWHFDHAVKWHATYGTTLEGYISHFTQQETAQIEREIESASKRDESWHVISWHSRADLAKPSYIGAGDLFKVEAINGGVRS